MSDSKCDNLNKLIGKRLLIKNSRGEVKKASVKFFVPMQKFNYYENRFKEVYDVEIILNKTRNEYFSISLFLDNMSSVANAMIIGEDKRIDKSSPIKTHRLAKMSEEDVLQADAIVGKFLEKIGENK